MYFYDFFKLYTQLCTKIEDKTQKLNHTRLKHLRAKSRQATGPVWFVSSKHIVREVFWLWCCLLGTNFMQLEHSNVVLASNFCILKALWMRLHVQEAYESWAIVICHWKLWKCITIIDCIVLSLTHGDCMAFICS